MKKCNGFFVAKGKEVLAKTENVADVVRNIPSAALDLLGIEVEKASVSQKNE
jgi:hypothetical protein